MPPAFVFLFLAALLAPASVAAGEQVSLCSIDLTFADGGVQTVGGRGNKCCARVGRVVKDVPYAGFVADWATDWACPRQDKAWQRFYEDDSCTGPATVNRRPAFPVGSVWICYDEPRPLKQRPLATGTAAKPSLAAAAGGGGSAGSNKPQRFVLRSVTTRQCLGTRDGVALLGQPRVLQAACSDQGDASQGWVKSPAGGGGGGGYYTIQNSKGCLTTYSGFAVQAAVVMPCQPGRSDQRWALDGKGPYTIRSPLTGACLSNVGKELVQVKCDPNDLNDLFESVSIA